MVVSRLIMSELVGELTFARKREKNRCFFRLLFFFVCAFFGCFCAFLGCFCALGVILVFARQRDFFLELIF